MSIEPKLIDIGEPEENPGKYVEPIEDPVPRERPKEFPSPVEPVRVPVREPVPA